MALAEEERVERVWDIDFEGNETYPGLVLRNVVGLESPSFFRKLRFWNRSGFDFDETELRRDEIRLQRFYERRGFPGVDVRSEVHTGRRSWVRNIVFFIEEGAPVIIEQVHYDIRVEEEIADHIQQQRDFERAVQRQPLREGRRYERLLHSDVEGLFRNTMRDMGFAHAEAEVSAHIDSSGTVAGVHITLTPGPMTYIGEILVDGVQTISSERIARHTDLKTGDLFRARNMRNAQQQVFGHPLIRFVTVNIPEQPVDSTVDISVRVREHALRSLQVQGGVGLEEIARLSVSWQHRNPFGNGHNFSVTTRASFLEQRANMDYLVPYVFNAKSRINISPFGQRLDESGYLLLRTGISNNFIYQLSRESAASFSYEFTTNRENISNPERFVREQEQIYNISALKFSGYYNQLEIERHQGWAIRPYAEFSGFLGTGSLRFNRYVIDIRRYVNAGANTQFALRTEGGLVTWSSLDDLPSNIRFYSGGSSSVRGWQRRQLGPKRAVIDDAGDFVEYIPLGGKANWQFNLEVRQELGRLIRNVGMALFLDGGAVWEELQEASLSGLQFGLGGGFRYNSPVGPVRIDLARKLNPTDEDLNIFEGTNYGRPFDHWGIHFSIGQAF